jgi:RimJ/RimL family protein N-acetyltransferase
MAMSAQPTLETERLQLRPFTAADAPAVEHLAGERAIAEMTLHVPHPYTLDMAEGWIGTHAEQFDNGSAAVFAIVRRDDDTVVGAMGLKIDGDDLRAELGYWIGLPFWGQGYCTEAARAVLGYGFRDRGLRRVHATHFSRNPASGRVMQKIGMSHEGTLRQHVCKWGEFEDVRVYGILREEFESAQEISRLGSRSG